MSRPDFERIRRNARVVQAGAGETATLRAYVSASAGAGAARFGAQPVQAFTDSIITGLFASDIFGAPRPQERDRGGGQIQDSRLMVTTDRSVHARDLLIWRGTAYRAAGESLPQNLGANVLWRTPLQLANPTG